MAAEANDADPEQEPIRRGPKGGRKHTPGHRPKHIKQQAKKKGRERKARRIAARKARLQTIREAWEKLTEEQRRLYRGVKGLDPDA